MIRLYILGILIFADVPVIYKSVSWWRTLHQPPSIIREGGSTMAPEMISTIGLCFAALVFAASYLVYLRFQNLKLVEEIEEISLLVICKGKAMNFAGQTDPYPYVVAAYVVGFVMIFGYAAYLFASSKS